MSAPMFRSAASRRRWTRATTAFVVLAWLVVPWHLCQQAWGGSESVAAASAMAHPMASSGAPCDHCPSGVQDRSSPADSLHQTLCKNADASFLGVEQHVPHQYAAVTPSLVFNVGPREVVDFRAPPPTPPPRRHRPLHLEKSVLLI